MKTELTEAFNDHAELKVGFTSTYPNRAQYAYMVEHADLVAEEKYGPQVLGLMEGFAIMCGSVEDDIGDILEVLLERAVRLAKEWQPDEDFALRHAALAVRRAYVYNTGEVRLLAELGQKQFGGSIADWEEFGYCDNMFKALYDFKLQQRSFERVCRESNDKAKTT